MQETQEMLVQSLNQLEAGSWREAPLEEGMATHSSVLAWRIPWTESHGGLQSMGSQESDTTERLGVHTVHPYGSEAELGHLMTSQMDGSKEARRL